MGECGRQTKNLYHTTPELLCCIVDDVRRCTSRTPSLAFPPPILPGDSQFHYSPVNRPRLFAVSCDCGLSRGERKRTAKGVSKNRNGTDSQNTARPPCLFSQGFRKAFHLSHSSTTAVAGREQKIGSTQGHEQRKRRDAPRRCYCRRGSTCIVQQGYNQDFHQQRFKTCEGCEVN